MNLFHVTMFSEKESLQINQKKEHGVCVQNALKSKSILPKPCIGKGGPIIPINIAIASLTVVYNSN